MKPFLLAPLLAVALSLHGQEPQVSDTTQLQTQLARDEKTLKDWPNLGRYREENATIQPPSPSEERVVFMG